VTSTAACGRGRRMRVVLDAIGANHLLVELLQPSSDPILLVKLGLLELSELLLAGPVLLRRQPLLVRGDAAQSALAPLDLSLLGRALRSEPAEDAQAGKLHCLAAVQAA